MNIGTRLKDILETKEITVSGLARAAGIPAQTIYAIIKRDSNKVDMDILAKILEALEMDFTEFLGQLGGQSQKSETNGHFLQLPEEFKERLRLLAESCHITEEEKIAEILAEFLESGFTYRPYSLKELAQKHAPGRTLRRQEMDDFLL